MNKLRIILGISFLLFLQPLHALAQGNEPPIPPAPTNGNVVLDTLDWLTASQESEINAINSNLDEDGIAQIAVVTLDDCGEDKQKFRNDLFRTWGIGHADDNDGLLILVCWYGGDDSRRSLEQETGYGLEGTLPDILTARVAREYFVPAFQANRPGDGLLAMVKQYDSILRQEEYPTPNPVTPPDLGFGWLMTGVLGIVPGYLLAKTYLTMTYPQRRSTITDMWEGRQIQSTNPNRRQFVIAEIISLLPILGILLLAGQIAALPLIVREYSQFMLPNLVIWLIVLVIYFIALSSSFFGGSNDGGWNSGTGWGPGNGGFGGFSDSGSDSSFGGGESGGGGSSTDF